MQTILKQKERLKQLIQEKAIHKRLTIQKPFKLTSGDFSDYYFRCKLVTQDPEGISLIAEIIYNQIKDQGLNRIGGIETGSIPICTAVAHLSYHKRNPISPFWVRNEKKDHGAENIIEGDLKFGEKIVLVDDVITTGKSLMKAVKIVKELNCEIVEILALVDREQGAKELFAKHELNFKALFEISDFNIDGIPKPKTSTYYCTHCGYGNNLAWGYCMRPSCRKKFPEVIS